MVNILLCKYIYIYMSIIGTFELKVKVKIKVTLEQAMKAQMGSRVALLFL